MKWQEASISIYVIFQGLRELHTRKEIISDSNG